MLLCALITSFRRTIKDRRFERNTLKRLLPIFALYILFVTFWFPFSPFGPWHILFGFTGQITETSIQLLYPRLEYLVAYTILGYILAESRGRLELPLSKDITYLFMSVTGVVLLIEFLSGFQIGRGASVVRFIFTIASTLFGGIIYHLSRDHIRFLLGR